MTYDLHTLLQDSKYKLSQFSDTHITAFEQRIFTKEVRGKEMPYTTCLIRNKAIKVTPEEIIRQLYLLILTEDLKYPADRIAVEYSVPMGREKNVPIFVF
jgi:type I restriction enzyme M protein